MKKMLKVKNKYIMPDTGPLDRELEDSLRRVRLPARSKLSYSDRVRRKKRIKRLVFVLSLVLIFILSYIFMSLMLKLSNMPAESAFIFPFL